MTCFQRRKLSVSNASTWPALNLGKYVFPVHDGKFFLATSFEHEEMSGASSYQITILITTVDIIIQETLYQTKCLPCRAPADKLGA